MEEKELKELEAQTSRMVEKASFITIHSQTTLDLANEFLKAIKRHIKKLDGIFDPITDSIKQSLKTAKEQKAIFAVPSKEAQEVIRKEITRYLTEEEEKRLKAEEEARQEKEKAFEKAREAEKLGFEEEAEKIRKEETKLATPLPPPVKAEGTHLRKNWTYEVTDITKVPREYLMINSVLLNATVRANKEKTNIPGIRAYQETSVSTRI